MLIWAHVSGHASHMMVSHCLIQHRDLSISRVAILNQLYQVHIFFCSTVQSRAHPSLARNILLYTLIADFPSERNNEYLQKIWNFYYHFFIDKETLDMLLKQCQVLLDLSPDIDTWNNSKYGAFLRFSSLHSLSTVRRNWALYIGTKDFSKSEMDSLRAEFQNASCIKDGDKNDVAPNMTSLRSTGPLCYEVYRSGPKQFDDRYWKTGVTFDEPGKVVKANEINPTFAYSVTERGFAVQTDLGFDLFCPFTSQKLSPRLAAHNQIKPLLPLASLRALLKNLDAGAWLSTNASRKDPP